MSAPAPLHAISEKLGEDWAYAEPAQNSGPKASAAQALQTKQTAWRRDERAIVELLLMVENEKHAE